MAIPKEVHDEIVSRADIVSIISSYINVIKKGNSYNALCPFHNDSNPSMQISPDKKIFKCFVCNEGGNAITFIQKYEKIPYREALKKAARLTSYTHPSLEEDEKKVVNQNTPILKALKDTMEFYNYTLNTSIGLEGKLYFDERKINAEMIEYFKLGYAPKNGELSIKALRSKGNDVQALEKAGVLIHEGGNFSDRYKGRVIFPIFNVYNEVIGFSGRILTKDKEQKYINSPSSDIFNKSAVLYNIQNAKIEAKRASYIYICEGFMDVFALYKVGIKSAICIMGTAFTKTHAKILKSLGVEIRLFLDGDDPGLHGMLLASDILDEEKVSYRIVNYQGNKLDPDEIYHQQGAENLVNIANRLYSKSDFLIDYFKDKYDLNDVGGKKLFIQEIAKHYSHINSPLEKEAFIKKISTLINVTYNSTLATFNSYLSNEEVQEEKIELNFVKKSTKLSKLERCQRLLLYFTIHDIEAYEYIKNLDSVVFISDIYRSLFNYISDLRYGENNKEISTRDIISLIQASSEKNEALIREITDISFDKLMPKDFDLEDVQECLISLRNEAKKKSFDRSFKQNAFSLEEEKRASLLDENLIGKE